jgi:hypothetical protein
MAITNDTPTIPAWLNIDEIVPPELRAKVGTLLDLSRDVLDAVARLLIEAGPLYREVERAIHSTRCDGIPDVVEDLIGFAPVEHRLCAATWLLEEFIGGSPTDNLIVQIASGLSDAEDGVGWSEVVEGELARRAEHERAR